MRGLANSIGSLLSFSLHFLATFLSFQSPTASCKQVLHHHPNSDKMAKVTLQTVNGRPVRDRKPVLKGYEHEVEGRINAIDSSKQGTTASNCKPIPPQGKDQLILSMHY